MSLREDIEALSSMVPREFTRRPRRGRSLWRDLVQLIGWDDAADSIGSSPSLILWHSATHELCHAYLLGMGPPWSCDAINDGLMALPPDERVDHEMRAHLIQCRVVEAITGEPRVVGRDMLCYAAGQGIGAEIVTRVHGGDFRFTQSVMREVAEGRHAGIIRGLAREMADRARSIVERHDLRSDAAAVLGMIRRARRELLGRRPGTPTVRARRPARRARGRARPGRGTGP